MEARREQGWPAGQTAVQCDLVKAAGLGRDLKGESWSNADAFAL